VTNAGSNDVSVIRTLDNTVVATVPVGTGPSAVATTPDGTFAYVTNAGSNNVSAINRLTNTVTATVSVGTGPSGVAIVP
jgi:YVTN family beta-propeller protein